MAPSREAVVPSDVPESVVNFRRVIPTADSDDVTVSGAVYRSGNLGIVCEDGATWMKKIGIKTLIDARQLKETTLDKNVIDKHYSLCNACLPFMKWRYHVGEKVKVERIEPGGDNQGRQHILVNFLRLPLYLKFLSPAPWYMLFFSLWALLKDLWNGDVYHLNFVRYFETRWPSSLSSQYRNILDGGKASIATVFKILAQPGALPAVIACKYGKDRTGILVALLLSLMGESREYIAWDYALTQEYMDPLSNKLRLTLCEPFGFDESYIQAKKEFILDALEYLDKRYGGVEAYLEDCGFGREEQETLKRNIAGKIKQS